MSILPEWTDHATILFIMFRMDKNNRRFKYA